MKASIENIKEGDRVFFNVDEYRNNRWMDQDGFVTYVLEDGVDVCYLSGYRSRNDFIPWKDVLAKLDKTQPWVKLEGTSFSGNFLVFDREEK